MPSSDPTALNAARLTPAESMALATRDAKPDEEGIVKAVKEMYSCKPTETTYDIYAPNAVFHDPIGYAEGVGSIRAQFNGLAKIFALATIPTFRVLSLPSNSSLQPNTLLIDQSVEYRRQPPPAEPTKTVRSLLTIERDSEGKVTRHTEEWDHKRETHAEDGWMGQLNQLRKQATAGLTAMAIGKDSEVPKKD